MKELKGKKLEERRKKERELLKLLEHKKRFSGSVNNATAIKVISTAE